LSLRRETVKEPMLWFLLGRAVGLVTLQTDNLLREARAACRITSALSVFQNVYTLASQASAENCPLKLKQLVIKVIAVY